MIVSGSLWSVVGIRRSEGVFFGCVFFLFLGRGMSPKRPTVGPLAFTWADVHAACGSVSTSRPLALCPQCLTVRTRHRGLCAVVSLRATSVAGAPWSAFVAECDLPVSPIAAQLEVRPGPFGLHQCSLQSRCRHAAQPGLTRPVPCLCMPRRDPSLWGSQGSTFCVRFGVASLQSYVLRGRTAASFIVEVVWPAMDLLG